MPTIDINAWSHASLLRIIPETEEGEKWCYDHINSLPLSGAYNAEHRYGPDILLAAHNAGLTVALDGEIADTPRTMTPCALCPDGRICATLGECFRERPVDGDA